MTNTLIHGIIDALSGSVSKEVIVFLISMIPILELRGALLVAGPILGVKVSTAIPICIIGNIIPVPFILLLITPVFNWISYPMGLYMKLFGVKEAFAAAPATLVGFTDMFIPALLLGSIRAVKTKFIVGVLSLVQIIYLTEVGTIIIKSEIPLNLWKLFVIFMERTLIAIPLIVLFANLFL